MPARFGEPVVTTLVGRLPFSAHEAAGAQGARHSLRPPLSEDAPLLRKLGRDRAARTEDHVFAFGLPASAQG